MQEQASSIVKPLILGVTHLADSRSCRLDAMVQDGNDYIDGRALR